ncbi:hypothetical protein EDD16DRAFT_1526655 [Pisolithus croceorrhizus]|nr:hypothetical protein EDD16DRAFT_1526655 [Pisolithus croceorrhizus]KAI6166500.1 hypothetical protein EDD17DRAFT_1504921 [Pisolithus thermaeus]
MPTLSTSMESSRQFIAEQGLGEFHAAIVQHGLDVLQESLTLAVKEYQSSGIHAKVTKSIQKAFEKYGDNVDNLCPVLVHIAKENQLYSFIGLGNFAKLGASFVFCGFTLYQRILLSPNDLVGDLQYPCYYASAAITLIFILE